MLLLALLLAFLSPSSAVEVEVFSDAGCSTSLGVSSVFAEICNLWTYFPRDPPSDEGGGVSVPTGVALGLDFCSTTQATVRLFVLGGTPTNEQWGSSPSCAGQSANAVDLALGACTAVPSPCPTCGQQFWKLVGTTCDPPTPSIMIQQDRGLVLGTAACTDLAGNTPGRFQTRQLLVNSCNPRRISFPSQQDNGRDVYQLGIYNEIESPPTTVAISYYPGNNPLQLTCASNVFYTMSVPLQQLAGTVCTSAPMTFVGAVIGLRAYLPEPYLTVVAPSPSAPAMPSVSPTPGAPVAGGASDTLWIAFGGAGIAIAVLAVGAMGFMYWRMTSSAGTSKASQPAASDWVSKSASNVNTANPVFAAVAS